MKFKIFSIIFETVEIKYIIEKTIRCRLIFSSNFYTYMSLLENLRIEIFLQ
jgi:hypothetical protein